MRQSILTVTSLSIVALAGAAIADAAFAQDVQVTYRSDPGPAHPRYAEENKVVGQAAAPAAVAVAYETAAYESAPAYTVSSASTVTVEAGDTVYALARRYQVSPSRIISANDLRAPYALQIGQRIVIPGETIVSRRDAGMSTPAPAPQPVQTSYKPSQKLDGIYRVQPGDTLYSLSRQFDIDLRTLADANNLTAPYSLAIDQRIIIPATDSRNNDAVIAARELDLPGYETRKPAEVEIVEPVRMDDNRILVSKTPESRFAWPLRGSIVMGYGMAQGGVKNDGINIAAPTGAPIRASEDGEVIYTGSELEGYGNLLLIRHTDGWVSAYAHTDTILVKKGDRVQQGQVVAKVGRSGNVEQPQLHFELRHELKPRDPLAALNGEDNQAREVSYQR